VSELPLEQNLIEDTSVCVGCDWVWLCDEAVAIGKCELKNRRAMNHES